MDLKIFLVLTYSPISKFTEKETITKSSIVKIKNRKTNMGR